MYYSIHTVHGAFGFHPPSNRIGSTVLVPTPLNTKVYASYGQRMVKNTTFRTTCSKFPPDDGGSYGSGSRSTTDRFLPFFRPLSFLS